jgi:rfaE bifunctional protein kinase chain/domain
MVIKHSLSQKLEHSLKRLVNWRALVVGDCMIDEYTFCETEKSKEIPSEMPGKRAYQATHRKVTLGGAANVAANLRALGAATSLVGVVGRDGYEKAFTYECEAQGISAHLTVDSLRPSTVKRRLYLDNEYFFRIDQESCEPIDDIVCTRVSRDIPDLIRDVDVVIISDYNKGTLTPKLITLIKDLTDKWCIPLIVDTKPSQIDLYRKGCFVVPNLIEAKALIPLFSIGPDLHKHTQQLIERTGTSSIGVTLGGAGICGIHKGEFHHIGGFTVPICDTVGAGDTVRAALALGISLQLPFDELLLLANAAGAVVVQKVGTATANIAEIKAILSQ